MGTNYFRQCESASFSQKRIQGALAKRGTMDVSFNDIPCDYDGGFGAYTLENGM